MIPGYMSVWLALIIVILFATGWKPYIAPRTGTFSIVFLLAAVVVAAGSGYWWKPLQQYPSVQLQLAVVVMLAACLAAWGGGANKGHRGYLVICCIMLSIIWGSVRSLYTHDPVLYWLEPSWNAPLLCGLLICAFTTNIRYQSGVLIWSAVLGDIISAWLDNGIYLTAIGSVTWWDSLSLALTAAYGCSLIVYFVKQSLAAISRTRVGMRRGRE